MKRLLVVALVLGVAVPAQLEAQRRVNVTLKAYDQLVMLDTLAAWNEVLASPAEVYAAARRILDSLKVPVSHVDSVGGLVMSTEFSTRRRIANKPASWALRCGMGLTGDYANYWRLSVAYAVFIDKSGDQSRLGVAIAAGALDIEGASKPPVRCGSTGMFEKEIAKLISLSAMKR
jgi:hypothetical protein